MHLVFHTWFVPFIDALPFVDFVRDVISPTCMQDYCVFGDSDGTLYAKIIAVCEDWRQYVNTKAIHKVVMNQQWRDNALIIPCLVCVQVDVLPQQLGSFVVTTKVAAAVGKQRLLLCVVTILHKENVNVPP